MPTVWTLARMLRYAERHGYIIEASLRPVPKPHWCVRVSDPNREPVGVLPYYCETRFRDALKKAFEMVPENHREREDDGETG